jgi:hypothetical protein
MSLNHSFKAAKKKITCLDAGERKSLLAICRDIQQAQQVLNEKSAPLMARCYTNCKGLCCRNIHPADIITEWDLIYILAMAPEAEDTMAARLTQEGFFPADCIFLKNGSGPCIFPDHLRPERCIISFCRVEPSVENEIARVMGGFSRLIRYFMFRPIRRLTPWLRPLDPNGRHTSR